MFQKNGPDKFARSMAVAVNTAITELEKNGPIPPEVAAEVGMDLFAKLLQDMATRENEGMEEVVKGVTGEQLQEVLPAILLMYSESHPDIPKEEIQAVMTEVTNGVVNQMGGTQPPPPALSTGPGPEPSGSPVPPGIV
jgi:hypothetical protein